MAFVKAFARSAWTLISYQILLDYRQQIGGEKLENLQLIFEKLILINCQSFQCALVHLAD